MKRFLITTAAIAALMASTGTGFAQFRPYGDPDEGPGVRFGGGYADEAFGDPDMRRLHRLERLRRERLRQIYGRPAGRGFGEGRGDDDARGDDGRGRPGMRGRGEDRRFGREDDQGDGQRRQGQGGQRQRMQGRGERDQADREPGDGGRGRQSGRQGQQRRPVPGQNDIPPEAMGR